MKSTQATEARFHEGQLVQHKRYNYRGVVVGRDPYCQAPDKWYRRNRTQPARDQPWYQVLVHGGEQTYVAEENLVPDDSGRQIRHPLVEEYFSVFLNGRYHRFSPN